MSPEVRLAICLFRLGRGDYLHTIGELVGLAKSTVCEIVKEVSEAIVFRFWQQMVARHAPHSLEDLKETMTDFDEKWQFPCCFGAIDGCHLPIKCPKGGLESTKEYHNFKNFFSIVIMAIVDAKYRFVWASSGYPGNSHDAIIFQSTHLYNEILNQNFLPCFSKKENDTTIYPMLLGDSAFPFLPWLMKPYTNTVLRKDQRYFNYRLSRARMVVEGAFGQLKGRWRILLRKNECHIKTLRSMSLACIVLHNICIDLNDRGTPAWDLSINNETQRKRPREEVRDLLHMTRCRCIPDSSKSAVKIRDCLKKKFWDEKLGKGVQ